jgi:hypothetical protein
LWRRFGGGHWRRGSLGVALALLAACSSKPTDEIAVTRGALANQPGTAGGQCGFVEKLANGDVLYAIKFPVVQQYVEVFSKKNGVQNIAQAMAGTKNADGTYTYRTIVPASTYASGNQIVARFYSYAPNQPGVFTPGPADQTWLPAFTYGSTTCSENLACGGFLNSPTYVTQQTNGDLKFSVTLPTNQQYVEVFVRQNDVQNIAQNIVASGVANPDGTKTYSLTSAASKYKAGDRILARFYSYKANSPGVFTPGSTDNVWAPLFVYGQSNTCDTQCAQNTCSGHGTCVASTPPGTIACNCSPGFQGTACGMSSFPPADVIPPRHMPTPPPVPGCYFYDANGWHADNCAPPGYVQQHFSIPTAPVQLSSNSFLDGGTFHAALPLVYGQTEVLFPLMGTEKAVFHDVGGIGGCPAMGADVDNQLSVQGNTNIFTGNNGDRDWVQFVLQSNGTENIICIWNIDVSKNGADDYHPTCYSPNAKQRSGGFVNFDSASVAGFIDQETGNLDMVAQLSWTKPGDPTHYAVVTGDEFGLAPNWTQFDGEVVGMGCGGIATFTNTSVVTRMAVSSCPGDTQAGSPTCAPPDLQPNVTVGAGTSTGETSNLTAFAGAPAVSYLNNDLAIVNQSSSTSGMCIDPKHVYVRDRLDDLGGVPSNLNSQAFWDSPDVYLVPRGATVDVKTNPTETLLTAGGDYDIYVRVHNELGCNAVTGAKALVYLADPSALSTQWVSITGGQFIGPAASPTGVTVGPGLPALVGPFPFTAPATGLGNGHKCLLAAISADGEAAPANTTDAPGSNQVAQRNVQISSCAYPFTNASGSAGNLSLKLTVSPVEVKPSLATAPDVEISFTDADLAWFNVWNAQPNKGTDYTVSNAGGITKVRMGVNSFTLADVPLGVGATRTGTASITLLDNNPTTTLSVQATLKDGSGNVLVQNGGSCTELPPPIVK